MSRQKELDAHPKPIQEIELIGQLKNTDSENADGTQSVCFKDLRKTFKKSFKKRSLTFSQGSLTV